MIKWNEHTGDLIDSINDYKIIHCNHCGFKHAIPIPTNEFLDNYYKKSYFEKRKPDYFTLQKEDEKWWNMVFQERIEKFENNLEGEGRRILDVGCGPGFFLKKCKEMGWETIGLEPSPLAAEYANKQGLNVINGELNLENLEKLGKFDVIYMHGVLEHLPNPKNSIQLCYEHLNSGGLFFTSVANDYNPFQMILKEHLEFDSWWSVPPEHINYFTPTSIQNLLESCNMEKISMVSSFPMEIFLLMGENYIKNKPLGKECHNKRKKFEYALRDSGLVDFKEKLYTMFSQLGIGRQIDATFKKIK